MDMMPAAVIIIILSIALLYIRSHFRLLSIVSFLVIIILPGPFWLGLITDPSAIGMFGQIGIVLLLFTIDLEFLFEKLLHSMANGYHRRTAPGEYPGMHGVGEVYLTCVARED